MMPLANHSAVKFSPISYPTPMMKLSSVLSLSNRSTKRFTRTKSTPASITVANTPAKYLPPFLESFRVDEKPTEAAIIDEWMEDSVTVIVQNLKRAPLLVHVYPEVNRRGSNSKFAYKIDKAARENWPMITKSMRRSGEIKKSPKGLIFVGELLDDGTSEDNNNTNNNNDSAGLNSEAAADGASTTTRAWGILVQGKGVKTGPTCYLLKTTRVEASSHFCLTKVTNFRETALKQLQDSWLLK